MHFFAFFTSLEYCRHYENTHRKLKGNKNHRNSNFTYIHQKVLNWHWEEESICILLKSIIIYSFYEAVFYIKIDLDTCQTYATQRISDKHSSTQTVWKKISKVSVFANLFQDTFCLHFQTLCSTHFDHEKFMAEIALIVQHIKWIPQLFILGVFKVIMGSVTLCLTL